MRIVVIGDFHMHKDELDIARMAMEDVKHCSPDLVIPLGDFGTPEHIGTPKGIIKAKEMLDITSSPLRPIMGNHDLQDEAGAGKQKQGTMENVLRETFEVDSPYGVLEYEKFRLFFVSTDPQPADSCYQKQECYVAEEQFRYIKSKLDERRGVPALFFTHAPPLGSGLKTVPHVHVRATNAVLDQNHDLERWLALYHNYPEIIMWFSAHYHLSHHHTRAHTVRHGTHFFHTGVHGMRTRDGLRQSRIVDIDRGHVTVATLDHIKRTLTRQGGWQPAIPLSGLVHKKAFTCVYSTIVGNTSLLKNKLWPRGDGRYIVEAEDGVCWEVKPAWEAIFGALHLGEQLYGTAVTNEGIWLATEETISYQRWNDMNRFMRKPNRELQGTQLSLTDSIHILAPRTNDSAWACNDYYLYYTEVDGEKVQKVNEVTALPERPVKLIKDKENCYILGTSGCLYLWDGDTLHNTYPYEHVLDWNPDNGSHASICVSDQQLLFVYFDDDSGEYHEMAIDANIKNWNPDDVQVICYHTHAALIRIENVLYWWNGKSQPVERLHMQTDAVAAIARADLQATEAKIRFAITTKGITSESPKLEVWEYNRVQV